MDYETAYSDLLQEVMTLRRQLRAERVKSTLAKLTNKENKSFRLKGLEDKLHAELRGHNRGERIGTLLRSCRTASKGTKMAYLTVNIYDKEDRARAVKVLTQVRYQQNLSQVQVAEMVGAAAPHLSRCESGFRVPHVKLTRAWAEALGVTLIETA